MTQQGFVCLGGGPTQSQSISECCHCVWRWEWACQSGEGGGQRGRNKAGEGLWYWKRQGGRGSVDGGRVRFTDKSCVGGMLGADTVMGPRAKRAVSMPIWAAIPCRVTEGCSLTKVVVSLRVRLPGKVHVFQPTRLKMVLPFHSSERTLWKQSAWNQSSLSCSWLLLSAFLLGINTEGNCWSKRFSANQGRYTRQSSPLCLYSARTFVRIRKRTLLFQSYSCNIYLSYQQR